MVENESQWFANRSTTYLYQSLSCEYWSYHDHAPYLDLALQFF